MFLCLVSAAEKKEREESSHPVFIVKLRNSEFIKDSAASFMIHCRGNPTPDVKIFKVLTEKTFKCCQVKYNRWQRRICTLSVQLYSVVTSVNSVFVSDKMINNSDHFRIKCFSYSKISAILYIFLVFVFI